MREIFSFLFDAATEPLGLPVDFLTEWIILAITGFFSYIVAYKLVGIAYKKGLIKGKISGSGLHYFIRTVCFLVIWLLTYMAICAIKFVIKHWIIISIAVGIIGALIVSVLLIRFFKKRKVTC